MKSLLPAIIIFCVWFALVELAVAQNWQATGAPNNRWFSPACSADGTKLVTVVGNYLLASTNSGWNWFTNGAPVTNWTCVASSADGIKLVASAAAILSSTHGGAHGGPIYTSKDSGATWSLTSAPSNQWSWVASSADGSKLVACAAYNYSNTVFGSIYVSTNSGTNWTVTSAPTNVWNCVASSADGTRLIAAAGGIFISTNSGTTWMSNSISADYPDGDSPSWTSLASSADGSRLIGIRTYNGSSMSQVYVSTNFGNTWIATNLPTIGSGFVGMSADGNVMMASKGHLYISTDAGVTWLQKDIPGEQYGWGYGCVASSADGNKLFLALGSDDFSQPNSIYISYTSPKPQIQIKNSGAELAFSWIAPATNFVMQQSSDLIAWIDVTNAPAFNFTNFQYEATISLPSSNGFYRLKSQ